MARGPGVGVAAALKDLLLGSDVRLALAISTVLVAAAAAFILAAVLNPPDRTVAALIPLAQLLMTLLTPFSAALATSELRTPKAQQPAVRAYWAGAAIYAVAIGTLGLLACVLAVTALGAAPESWLGGPSVVVGSLLVQLIPVGVGCAAGLLLPRAWLACLTTVVVPLGVTLLLGTLGPRGAADWLTPLGAAGHLVPGPMSILNWAQWIVVAAL
ncbi:MAG: hypothetical protein L0H41_15230, partial [Microlunatus sp.]|nr:hypothetical protein [Microlunatus sp.]